MNCILESHLSVSAIIICKLFTMENILPASIVEVFQQIILSLGISFFVNTKQEHEGKVAIVMVLLLT